MFLVGVWKNYDDMEEAITLDELLDIYQGILDREVRHTKSQARIMGAEWEEDDEETEQEPQDDVRPGESRVEAIARRTRERAGQEEGKVLRPDFGAGMGYKQV